MTAAAATTTTPDVDPDNLGAEGVVTPDPPETDPAGADNLGDAGKKALDEMKTKWRAERDRAKTLEQQLAEARKPPAAADAPPDLDAIRKEAREQAAQDALKERAMDKLEAKAARLFQDPEDARAFLAGKVDDFIDGQSVDVEAISDALKDLLEKRPYLGVTQGEPKRFQGTADGGARGTAGKPQLSEADVKRMSKEGKHGEIEQARQEGRLDKLLGITPSA